MLTIFQWIAVFFTGIAILIFGALGFSCHVGAHECRTWRGTVLTNLLGYVCWFISGYAAWRVVEMMEFIGG